MLKKDLEKIKKSEEFKSWKSEHKNSFLCGCFSVLEDLNKTPEWQVDFYDPQKDIISSFIIKDNQVILSAEDKVFKKPEDVVEKLELSKVKISLKEALTKVSKIKNKDYPKENIAKVIIILQKIETPLWNISCLTTSMNLLNVKINAINDKIIKQDFVSMLKFKAA